MTPATDLARVVVSSVGERREFSLPWETTVAEFERRAVESFGLQASAATELWCGDGTCMSNKMGRTLGELRDRLICPKREFELRPVAVNQ